jgi:tricorn protease
VLPLVHIDAHAGEGLEALGTDAQLAAAVGMLEEKMEREPVLPLKPKPLGPLGTPAEDVKR